MEARHSKGGVIKEERDRRTNKREKQKVGEF